MAHPQLSDSGGREDPRGCILTSPRAASLEHTLGPAITAVPGEGLGLGPSLLTGVCPCPSQQTQHWAISSPQETADRTPIPLCPSRPPVISLSSPRAAVLLYWWVWGSRPCPDSILGASMTSALSPLSSFIPNPPDTLPNKDATIQLLIMECSDPGNLNMGRQADGAGTGHRAQAQLHRVHCGQGAHQP